MELSNSILNFVHAFLQTADKLIVDLDLHQDKVQWFHDLLLVYFMLLAVVSIICLSSTYQTKFLVSTVACFAASALLAVY